jgi:hypothetical protein
MGETPQLSFALKNIGQISVDLGEVPPNREKLGLAMNEFRPKRKKFARNFRGRSLTAGFARSPGKIITVQGLIFTDLKDFL